MKTNPNCKINLGLNIVGKRPDGYHNLETVFVPVPLCDELEIERADTFSFVQEGIELDNVPEDNLCVRAYRLLQDSYPEVGPVSMRLRKNVPFGAGLGGGSSDAAFTIKMLVDMFSLPCTIEEQERYADPSAGPSYSGRRPSRRARCFRFSRPGRFRCYWCRSR